MNRVTAEALQRSLVGGLYVDDDGSQLEAAMMHIAAAQLRAIRIAMLVPETPDPESGEDGRQAWCVGDTFTKADAATAIGGVMALLHDAHFLASDIRHALKDDGVATAAERDLEVLRQAAAQREGGAP